MELKSKVSTVSITGNVRGAHIRIRGLDAGVLPLSNVRVSAGDAEIDVAAEGYTPYHAKLALVGGSSSSVEIALVAIVRAAVLNISAKGIGAKIFVDGAASGVSPVELQVSPGTHRLVARREGQSDMERTVVLEPGMHKDVMFDAPEGRAITSQWWFWTGIGVVVAATATVTVYALTTEKAAPTGDHFQPSQTTALSRRF